MGDWKTMNLGAAIVAVGAGAASAQTGTMYLLGNQNGGGTSNTYVIQGGALVNTFSRNTASESCPAINGTIRTYGTSPGQSGAEYDLLGAPQGPTYPNNGQGDFYDGTTDGTHNYGMQYSSGTVWQFDTSWGSPQALFTTQNSDIGLTWDSGSNTLWAAGFGGNGIRQYSMGGSLVATIPIQGNPNGTQINLAYDYSDNTLWTATYTGGGGTSHLQQYDPVNGNLIQEFDISSPSIGGSLGAEFNLASIPAPGAGAILGIGGLIAARRRRA
jgi:hypothetical protein